MRKGAVAPRTLRSGLPARPPAPGPGTVAAAAAVARGAMLEAVLGATGPADALVATTGYTGRELYALGDRPGHFYMVGSMGCALSVGLGIATAQPERRVIVLDGDGALLMRLGALATAGYYRPARLVHVLLDNGVHESTGGQGTVSPSVDFCALARACGYPRAVTAADPAALGAALAERAPGPLFIRAPIRPGVPADLPRPREDFADLAARFRRHLEPARDGATAPA
jgi:phosphonopyruvate decarboxylase